MKKAERLAKAAARQTLQEQYAREESAMETFLSECRGALCAVIWDREFTEAKRYAGNTFHIVERMVFVLAATQQPITPSLRRSLDAMLETLGIDRGSTRWEELRALNYGAYWKTQYGY